MANSKSTKRALFTSALAILMCVVMLVGTTFAWFTDSASTAVNKIQAGNLKISLLDSEGNDLTQEGEKIQWKVQNKDNQRGEDGRRYHLESDVLWEPGCKYFSEYFYIKNEGNLAVKYKLNISFTGGDTKLLEALEFSGVASGATITGDGAGTKIFGSFEELNNYEGYLLPKGEDGDDVRFNINVSMKEEAGNEYQGLNLGDMSITVVATQYTYESDSKGKDYDANAQYPVADNQSFVEALENIGTGETLSIAAGEYKVPATTPANGATLSGAGTDKTVLKPENKSYKTTDVSYKNMTIDGTDISSVDNNGVIWLDGTSSVLDNVEVVGGGTNTYGYSVRAGANTTITNSYIHGAFRAIMAYDVRDTLLVENCILAPQCYTINIDAGTGKLVVNNSTLKGWTSYTSSIESATFTDCVFEKNTASGSYGYNYLCPHTNTVLKNCTFNGNFQIGAGSSGFTITIDNCTLNGVEVTAENVNNMLDIDDVLKGCTIIVNGVTVTW